MSDFNLLTPEEKDIEALKMLCRRIIDVDPDCSNEKGCPYELVVVPIFMNWVNYEPSWTNAEIRRNYPIVREILGQDGQGRSCEFYSAKFAAERFLKEV